MHHGRQQCTIKQLSLRYNPELVKNLGQRISGFSSYLHVHVCPLIMNTSALRVADYRIVYCRTGSRPYDRSWKCKPESVGCASIQINKHKNMTGDRSSGSRVDWVQPCILQPWKVKCETQGGLYSDPRQNHLLLSGHECLSIVVELSCTDRSCTDLSTHTRSHVRATRKRVRVASRSSLIMRPIGMRDLQMAQPLGNLLRQSFLQKSLHT